MAKKTRKKKAEPKAAKSVAGTEAEAEKLTELRTKFKRLYDEIRQRLSVLNNVSLQVGAVHDILTKALTEYEQARNANEVTQEAMNDEPGHDGSTEQSS